VRLILLHNPGSGDEDHSRDRLEAILAEAGHDVVYRSLDEDHWRDVLAEEEGAVIVVAGGDGSVRKVFTALGRPAILVTLFPAGSANNIARTLGFETDDPARLLRGWEPAARQPYDLWNVESTWGESRCVESFGGGLFADALALAQEESEDVGGDEKVEQGLELLRDALEQAQPQVWELVLDGRPHREELIGLEVMNVRELGPNLPLAPDADPGDGLLDVVLLRADDVPPLAAYVAARLDSKEQEPEPPRLDRRRCAQVELEPPSDGRVHVDDLLPAWDEGGPRRTKARRILQLEVLVPAFDDEA
jgi:diacylglycerol kinase (ATP)